VHALFMVVSPTVPVHLRILGQLGFLLRDTRLRQLLGARAPADQILGQIEMLETTVSTTGSFPASRAAKHATHTSSKRG
jgi:PTS system nitrogen regulatory IIA component